MASVTSFTAEKIQELLSGYDGISLSQEEMLSLIGQLYIASQSHSAEMTDFRESVLPSLLDDLANGSTRVSALNDRLPEIEATIDQANLDIENLNTVDLPALREDLDATITNAIDRPKVYVQPDAPTNPDEEERYLVVGDTWFDSDDNNRQTIWNGVEWSTFNVDIPDFSLTVRKLISTHHQIY